jgi:hypothetical protein
MTTQTRRTKKTADRHATLSTMTNGKTLLWIQKDGQLNGYVLSELQSQIGGVGFQLGRATPDGCSESYEVLIHGHETSCSCPGNIYRPNQPCKHIAALMALLERGRLSEVLRKPA